MKYEYTPDMREISGFGGGYEGCCRAMVIAGLEWLDEHPGADPQFTRFSQIYGVINEENEDARSLTRAMLAAKWTDDDGNATTVGEYGATGAMHQATVGHVLHIRQAGWSTYVQGMRLEVGHAAIDDGEGDGPQCICVDPIQEPTPACAIHGAR